MRKSIIALQNTAEDVGRWTAVLSGHGKTATSRLGLHALSQVLSQFLWWPQFGCHLLSEGFYGPLIEINSLLLWFSLELCTSNFYSIFPGILYFPFPQSVELLEGKVCVFLIFYSLPMSMATSSKKWTPITIC